MQKVYFHVDLDAFYASVEQADYPEYREKPVIIGAKPGSRGVVSACSYEARVFGIHSAMPISEAYRRCPKGIYLPVRMGRYQELSRIIMKIFGDFTPDMQQISVDEAFLNMTGTERLFGSPKDAAMMVKNRVKEITNLNASVGVAPNRYIAKIASDFDKPDGLTIVLPGGEMAFVDKLKLKDIWGLGAKTLERLNALNIFTVQQLRSHELEKLSSLLGKGGASFLYKACRGIDPGIIDENPRSHSISNEITFEKDTAHRETLETLMLDLSHQVMFRSLEEKAQSRTVVLKLRFHDFTSTTAQISLDHALTSAEEIYKNAKELLEKRWDGQTPIRLLGVGLAQVKLGKKEIQGELFGDPYERQKKVERTVFNIQEKGSKLVKATLLNRKNPRRPIKGDPEYHGHDS